MDVRAFRLTGSVDAVVFGAHTRISPPRLQYSVIATETHPSVRISALGRRGNQATDSPGLIDDHVHLHIVRLTTIKKKIIYMFYQLKRG